MSFTNISFVNSKTSDESCSNDKPNTVFDTIINGKKEALADMDYLDNYTDNYKYDDEENISIYSDEKYQKINSYVFLVPSISETSVLDELTGIF